MGSNTYPDAQDSPNRVPPWLFCFHAIGVHIWPMLARRIPWRIYGKPLRIAEPQTKWSTRRTQPGNRRGRSELSMGVRNAAQSCSNLTLYSLQTADTMRASMNTRIVDISMWSTFVTRGIFVGTWKVLVLLEKMPSLLCFALCSRAQSRLEP